MGAAIVFSNDDQTVILDRSYEEVIDGINKARKENRFFEYIHTGKKFAVNTDHIRFVREKK